MLLFWRHQRNANRNKCLASCSTITTVYCWLQWSCCSIMRCLAEKPTLEYLKNTLWNKMSRSKPYLFAILLEAVSSYLRLNSWELEAKNRRFNTPAESVVFVNLEYQSNANYDKCLANNYLMLTGKRNSKV